MNLLKTIIIYLIYTCTICAVLSTLLIIIEIVIRNNVHFLLNNNTFTIADTPCSLYTVQYKFIEKPKTKEPPKDFTGIAITKYGGFFVEKWYLNGILHRTDGPAINRISGSREWYYGDREWWLNDKQVSEEQHKLLVDILKLKGLL